MAAPRGGQRSRFTVMVLVMICLTLVTIDSKANGGGVLGTVRSAARDVLVPAQSGLGQVAQPVAEFADGLVNAGDLKAESRRLRDENGRLQSQVLQAADTQRQLDALRDLNKLEVAKDIPRIAARVVNTAPSNVQLTVEIDRGTNAGVATGMPVVVGTGLVGRIASASGERAIVRLITDPDVNVSARLAPSGILTSVKGNGAGALLRAEEIKPDEDVNVGDVVVTSAIGGNYPDSIPIGRVVKAEALAGVSYQQVDIEPAIDLGRLEFVNVLVRRGPSGAEEREERAAETATTTNTTTTVPTP